MGLELLLRQYETCGLKSVSTAVSRPPVVSPSGIRGASRRISMKYAG
ncbi:MAG: hypothetical protein K9M81_01405 [Chthoniobacterales bacterium]|nr:hypothetical protein [Chthoniobacterales bacterium]